MTKVYSLHFHEIGRMKQPFDLTFEGESMQDIPPSVIRRVRTEAGLISAEVELEWDEDAGTGAVIVGGFRPAGTFSIQSAEKVA
jgi:hypothetical protein